MIGFLRKMKWALVTAQTGPKTDQISAKYFLSLTSGVFRLAATTAGVNVLVMKRRFEQTRIPVLTWHGYNVFGNTYETNDLIAFADDLHTLDDAGFAVVPLMDVARWVRGERADFAERDRPVVALSCDDGTDYDWRDMQHPEFGAQQSFANSLRAFQSERAATQPAPNITSFVIASPTARDQIDAGAMNAQRALNDDWWAAANASSLMNIESHGWDHNHPTVSPVVQRKQQSGDFFAIDTFAECDTHVRAASQFIASMSGRKPALFAYPWTHASDYMRRVYMPEHAEANGTIAAFGGQSDYLTQQSDRWYLPRFVFGPDWKNANGLRAILNASLT
jgi:hypothetical protein